MAEYHSEDCGETRSYEFRRIKTAKIKFRVKTARDAAICLNFGTHGEHNYEIFIGCWGGDESGIRKQESEDLVKVQTEGILSDDEFRGFWITVKRNKIKVGKRGDLSPFMVYEDTDGIGRLTHYGFSTGWGSEGDWIFADGDEEEPSSSSSSESEISSSDSEAEELNTMERKPIQYKRPARWVHGAGGHMPRRPVCGGEGEEGPVYVAMGVSEGEQSVGMLVPGEGVAYLPLRGEAVAVDDYFVLGNPGRVSLAWVAGSAGKVPPGALEGGVTGEGETMYIGRVMVDGVVSVGKVIPSTGVCFVPYGGAEHKHRDYEVLCVSNVPVSLLGIM